MSGGVDSSVAAHLLKQRGYEVIGLTFRGWPQDCRSIEEDKCCGPQAVADARMVAHSLDIPYYVVDEIDTFRREVMDYFAAEYKRGRTPNPCVICNEKVKFGSLLRKAQALGAEFIATGHYARITEGRNGQYELRKSRDPKKDQTYFLFSLHQEQLARAMFPLGELTKEETRAIAEEIGLKTYGKEESQREGLNLGGLARPLYVMELDAAANRVVVGSAEDLLRGEFEVSRCVWHIDEPAASMDVTVKPRHQHPGCKAVLEWRHDGTAQVRLSEPQRAITPGQAAVFYQGDVVIAGGWIC
jgi:tRNA-specific 2-thiouridylase